MTIKLWYIHQVSNLLHPVLYVELSSCVTSTPDSIQWSNFYVDGHGQTV